MALKFICRKIDETRNSTISMLSLESVFVAMILEDGYRYQKEYGLTRIDPGIYPIVKQTQGKFYNKYKSRYGHDCVFRIDDVPRHDGILIHIGNHPHDTAGCPLTCTGFQKNGSEYMGLQSEDAYLKFYNMARPLIDDVALYWEVIR